MIKKDIFHKIKSLSLPDEASILLSLIEKNINRIEYVKDHLGLKDFLFIAEKESHVYEFNIFACFDVDVVYGDKEHNFLAMNDCLLEDVRDIYYKLDDFFKYSDRILYVGIGFADSAPTPEDHFQIFNAMERNEIDDPMEALVKMRRFPDWYVAKFPQEVEEAEKLMDRLRVLQNQMKLVVIEDKLRQIDIALKHNDQTKFKDLSREFSEITS